VVRKAERRFADCVVIARSGAAYRKKEGVEASQKNFGIGR
jgi:hypothetical protein